MKDKWDIVSEVYEDGSFCGTCEYYDAHGDCRLLTQDRMVPEYCLGWDTWVEHMQKAVENQGSNDK